MHSADNQSKAEMLFEMTESAEHPSIATLFMNAMLCYEEAVFPMLMESFLGGTSDKSRQQARVTQSLVRTGTRFGNSVLELLRSGTVDKQAMGLVGCDAIARSLCSPWLNGVTKEQFLNDLRTRDKWAPVSTEDIGVELVAELTNATAAIVTDGPEELRAQALRVLGYLKAENCAELIRKCLSDPGVSVRQAAIFAVSELGDAASADALIKRVLEGAGQERAAAVAALGRLQIGYAEHLLVEMTASPEEQVREAAVVALGEMGTISSRVVLQELTRSSDRKLQKIAAKAAFGGVKPKKRELSEVERRLAEKRRKVSPVAAISLDAVMRFSLPEIRSYEEMDLTDRIAQVCSDHSATRRYMIELGFMNRANGVYELTESGKSAWRVEQFICERYLGRYC
jgi:hypothetical protein